ncbi:DUF5068 domain-containing protein [Jeotgalibacillus proteolyticus]|uniref:DUF5068 domain-containing protein n=1 Tax=Jeotgalibacillus proteolyticus TaxID=2082395 RepID=A0A2S5GD72_9BACL|nr:DUF5068 domain-containing protein [Jeotgalibacillus proteolyticus]PPA70987.1 DUF5068 domain-containing protein [Jeotgalibacillus proteolyticus]
MKKSRLLLAALLSLLLILAACGNEKASSEEESNSNTEAEENAELEVTDAETADVTADEETEDPTETEEAEADEASDASGSGTELNPAIAEESEGNVEIIYTNQDPGYVHNMDDFIVTVDEYQIVQVTDMNQNNIYSFDEQTEGYVVTAKVTLDNTRDTKVVYNNMYRIQYANETDFINNDISKTFVKDTFPKSETETEVSTYGAGEKVTGLISFTLTNEEFEALSDVQPKFIIEGGAADDASMAGSFKGNAVFDFLYSGEQQEVTASAPSFYPDRLTTDNMADKEMIFEESDLNESQSIDDVMITLEGVQYAEVLPTETNEERFSNFGDNGIVALTVKFNVDNQTGEPISLFGLKSKVLLDEDRGSVLAQGMVEPREPIEIAAGEQGEKIHVFMFRKDEFELYEQFDVQFGPFIAENGEEAFKGKSVVFSLPKE